MIFCCVSNFQVHKAERDAYLNWWKAKKPVSVQLDSPDTAAAAAPDTPTSSGDTTTGVAYSNDIAVQAMSGGPTEDPTAAAVDVNHSSNSSSGASTASRLPGASPGTQTTNGNGTTPITSNSSIPDPATTTPPPPAAAAAAGSDSSSGSYEVAGGAAENDGPVDVVVDGQAGSADSDLLLKRWLLASVGLQSQEILAEGRPMVTAYSDGFDDQNPGINVDLKALSDASECDNARLVSWLSTQ